MLEFLDKTLVDKLIDQVIEVRKILKGLIASIDDAGKKNVREPVTSAAAGYSSTKPGGVPSSSHPAAPPDAHSNKLRPPDQRS